MVKGSFVFGKPGSGRNDKWDDLSPKGKRMLIESLPLPLPVVGGIMIGSTVIPSYLAEAFFPDFDPILFWIGNAALLIVYMFWVLIATGLNYKKRTGRDFYKDMENEAPGYVK